MTRNLLRTIFTPIMTILLFPTLILAWTPGLQESAEAVARGTASPAQEMQVFLNNPEVNLLAQEGKISEYTYASCQDDFFRLNEGFADQAVREAGFDPSISKRKFNPGTDTDVNVNARGGKKIVLKDIDRIDDNYQRIVKQHFKNKGLDPPDGPYNTDTDFMPNPSHTDPDEFKRIVRHINETGGTAYTDPKAASAQSKLGTSRAMTIDEASSFSSTMKDMADAKIRKADLLRQQAKAVRSTDPGQAEFLEAKARQYDYQASKYHNRIDKASEHLRSQYNLDPPGGANAPRKGFGKAMDNIDSIGRNPFSGKDASAVHNLHKSRLQSSADDMIDTLLEVARKDPSKASDIGRALAREVDSLPGNRAGQAIDRIDDAMRGVDSSFAPKIAAKVRGLKQARRAASKWTSFKNSAKRISGLNQVTKLSVVMTAGGAMLMAHQGITITLDNVKATDTLWDYFKNCYYHAAWEGTGIGPAFEQAQREEIERYLKEHEAGQAPSMVKHVTLTLLKTGTYMGRDAVIGVLYLPDAIWEYFTEEKAMEGYARMQNELAKVMRQMVLVRKAFNQVMTNMKKMGLHDEDALDYLNCLCSGCGGSLGGFYNPSFKSDIGHGPCQCNGPLTIWKTPLPADNKEAQRDCFNKVAKMRYNEARAIFDAWNRKMTQANAESVQEDLDAIMQEIRTGKPLEEERSALDLANRFNAIKELALPQDVDSVRAMIGPYIENHAVKRVQEGKVREAIRNLDTVLDKVGTRQAQHRVDLTQRRKKYEQWDAEWAKVKNEKFPDIRKQINGRQVQRAAWEIDHLEHLMLKAPLRTLPPATHDPAFVRLKEQVENLKQEYRQTMTETWAKIRALERNLDRKKALKLLEKTLADWEHSPEQQKRLKAQIAYDKGQLHKASRLAEEGEHQEENKAYARAVEKYTASLKIQNDRKLGARIDKLEKLMAAKQKQSAEAATIRQEAEALQRAGKYEEALKKYRQGLRLGSNKIMEDRAKKLEKYIALTKNRKPFTAPTKTVSQKQTDSTASSPAAAAGKKIKPASEQQTPDGLTKAEPASWKQVHIGNIGFQVPASWQHETKKEPGVDLLHLYWEGSLDAPVHGVSGGITPNHAAAARDMEGTRSVTLGGTGVLRADDGPAINLLFPAMADSRAVTLILFRGQSGSQAVIDTVLKTIVVNPVEQQTATPDRGVASGPPEKTFDNGNIYGVGNGPTSPTTFTLSTPRILSMIQNYHWNSARGATAGTIALRHESDTLYGPWQTTGSPGQGGVPDAYWTARPMVVLPAGTYTVIDSDPGSWAQNRQSKGKGFTKIETRSPGVDQSSGQSPAGAGFIGKWESTFGELTFQIDQNGRVTGTYPHDQGRISGTFSRDGRTFSGTWSEAPTHKPPRDAGGVELVLSIDGRTFTGRWGFGEGTMNSHWTGKRKQ
ncbi:MAG TPA: hypothetical protein VJ934_04270 [Desulfomicrobiaceae bacterium]|nr:hypothetical protein [Desulfomicrobiaceae bacterium]